MKKSGLVLVFLAAVVPRLILFFWLAPRPQSFLAPDSGRYQTLASNLRNTGRFTISNAPPFLPEVNRTPGYPFFLALLRVADRPARAALAQVFVDSLSAVLVSIIAMFLVSGPL